MANPMLNSGPMLARGLAQSRASEPTYAALRTALAAGTYQPGQFVFVEGRASANDGGQGMFQVKAIGSLTDDGGVTLTGGSLAAVRVVLDGRISALWYGVVGDGATNNKVAIDAAIAAAAGKRLFFPSGSYLTSGGHALTATGSSIFGEGIDATRFILSPGSSEDSVFCFGNKSVAVVTKHIGARDFRVQLNGQSKLGFEIYGLRDGSFVDSVYVSEFSWSAVKLGMAGGGTGAATGLMNQGVVLRQVVCETSEDVTAPNGVIDIDGTFETTLDTCAVKGASAATNTATAISVGESGECRNVVMENCALAHLKNGDTSYGIRYGQWARECRDIFTTFEDIKGSAVYFHGSATSGNNLPAQCKSLHPRLYKTTTAGIVEPAFLFGDAHACFAGPVVDYQTTKVWVEFETPVSFQTHNTVEVLAGAVSPESIGSNIVFDSATPLTNYVYGSSSSDSNLRTFRKNRTGVVVDYSPNGGALLYGSTYDSYDIGASVGVRWQHNGSTFFELERDHGARVVGASWFTAQTSPSQITADQNNYDAGKAGWWRLSSDASRTVTGLVGGKDGRHLNITNVGGFDIVVAHENALSSAANRVISSTGADVVVGPNATVSLVYDSTSSRWRVV